MTYQDIKTMLDSIAVDGKPVPYAYYQFAEDTAQPPPFICFYYSGDNDFLADNSNYQRIAVLVIELYTDEKDFALENTVENALASAELVYTKNESYIDSEKMLMVTYETNVIITKGENNGR